MENSNLVKYSVSIDEINALKLLYYNVLYGLDHYKGFKYRQCFKILKEIHDLIPKTKDLNFDNLFNIYDDSEVFGHEDYFNS